MRFTFDRSFYMPAKDHELHQVRIDGLADEQGVAFVYACNPERGTWGLIVFRGKQAKPIEHSIRVSEAKARSWATKMLESIAGSIAAQAERKAAEKARRAALNSKVAAPAGSIFVRSWGYDQTQVDGIEVVGHFGKLGVEVKVAGMSTVPGSGAGGHDADRLIPVPGRPGGHARRAMLRDAETVLFEGESYHKWDGKRSYHHSWGH